MLQQEPHDVNERGGFSAFSEELLVFWVASEVDARASFRSWAADVLAGASLMLLQLVIALSAVVAGVAGRCRRCWRRRRCDSSWCFQLSCCSCCTPVTGFVAAGVVSADLPSSLDQRRRFTRFCYWCNRCSCCFSIFHLLVQSHQS